MTRLPATVDDLRGLRAARWIRESTAGQYDRYGPEVQTGQIASAIRRLGLVDTGLAWSPAHSGSTVPGSPAMRAMLEAASAAAFDVLVVARSDRWQRNLRQTLNLLEDDLRAVGVVVWSGGCSALTMLHCAGCGRHLIGDTGRYRHPEPCEAFTAVRREPWKRGRGQRVGMPGHSYRAAESEAIVRDVLGDVSLGSDRIAAVVEATRAPEPDRLAIARIGRERGAALARYWRDRDLQALEAAMAVLDEQEAEARDRQPTPELSAA